MSQNLPLQSVQIEDSFLDSSTSSTKHWSQWSPIDRMLHSRGKRTSKLLPSGGSLAPISETNEIFDARQLANISSVGIQTDPVTVTSVDSNATTNGDGSLNSNSKKQLKVSVPTAVTDKELKDSDHLTKEAELNLSLQKLRTELEELKLSENARADAAALAKRQADERFEAEKLLLTEQASIQQTTISTLKKLLRDTVAAKTKEEEKLQMLDHSHEQTISQLKEQFSQEKTHLEERINEAEQLQKDEKRIRLRERGNFERERGELLEHLGEREAVLAKLEEEQADMIERVEKLQKGMMEKKR